MSGNPNLQPVRKRKKRAPYRQQPEWLFPADEENPALKPHQEPTLQEKLEKRKSIELLKRRAVGVPANKPVPPVQLLNLIGAFLAEYGFQGTGRLFSAERQGRSKLDGWKDETGEKLEKGMPTLSKIYKEWRKEWDERRLLDMTSSDDEDDAATKREEMLERREKIEQQKKMANDDATSSSGSGSTSSEDGDVEMKDAPPVKKVVKKSSSSSGSSSSDSDADDEKDISAPKVTSSKSKANILKRKASINSSSSSASTSAPSSGSEAPKTKKAKTVQESSSSASETTSDDDKMVDSSGAVRVGQTSSDSSSTSDSDPDSDSSANSIPKKTPLPAPSESESFSKSDSDSSSNKEAKKKPAVSSDTSATLSDGPRKVSPGSSGSNASSSNSNANTSMKAATQKSTTNNAKPARKKTNDPFSRIPKDIKVDERLASNAYVPYDYAQKAHEDLIVTRGKGFTKEKNKKKRGSYRGGYIDVEGKKGIKFED